MIFSQLERAGAGLQRRVGADDTKTTAISLNSTESGACKDLPDVAQLLETP